MAYEVFGCKYGYNSNRNGIILRLCAASFLPAYIGALYFKNLPRAAAKWGMIAGFTTASIWILFVHDKESSSLQLCKLIFGKTSIVKGTAFESLLMVDPIFVVNISNSSSGCSDEA